MKKRLFKYVFEQYRGGGDLVDKVTKYREQTDEEAAVFIDHELKLYPSYKVTAYVAELPEFEYFISAKKKEGEE